MTTRMLTKTTTAGGADYVYKGDDKSDDADCCFYASVQQVGIAVVVTARYSEGVDDYHVCTSISAISGVSAEAIDAIVDGVWEAAQIAFDA